MGALQPHVEDDFEPLKTAVVYEDALSELLWKKGDFKKDLERILLAHGVEILTPLDSTKPKAYWARDPLYVVDQHAFVVPQSGRRREEYALMHEFLQDERIPHTMAKVDGGDVLLPDRSRLFVGFHGGSEEEADIVCDDIAAVTRRIVVAVHHTGVHLDTCIAPLPDHRLLMHPDRITAQSRLRLEEIFGRSQIREVTSPPTVNNPILNLLWLNPTTVLAPANGIGDLLRSDGYTVIEMEGGEKRDGNARCSVTPLIRRSVD